jgi:cold-inducible RNA-binding protein
MSTKLFVGSLSWNTTDQMLQDFFMSAGNVVSAKVIMDRQTGRSRGFGFVEYASPEEAERAVQELNGKELDGRQITVNEARPQEQRTGGGFHGGRGGRDDRRQGGGDGY